MRSSLVMSLIGATSMALALLVGCGDDDTKPAQVFSKVGQSCTKTADCEAGLSCIDNICYKTPPPPTGGGAGDSSVAPPEPRERGGEGESCSSRLDCAEPLGCFNNRCTVSDMGEGGATGGLGIQLGARGESCRVNGDCAKDLVCVPSATTGGGACDLADFGIEPTGKSCGGECLEDADCCQLPIGLHTATVTSCADIAEQIKAGIDCDAPDTPTAKTLCFEQATYCDCGDDTWHCTDNLCSYGEACVVAAGVDVPTGCPTHSRTRSLAGLTCNADTLTCVGDQVAQGCTNDKSCETKPVFDRAGDVCAVGECTCAAANKQCYKKCARDIDCGANQTCDAGKTKLCVPSGACTSDSYCAVQRGSTDFKCHEGACTRACAVDRDCSPSGILNNNPFNGQVCGADGFCASVAMDCDENTQCPLTAGLKTFCIDNKEAADTFSSAITD